MKNLIKNIVLNSKDSKMLRKDIYDYFKDNEEVKRKDIRTAISELVGEGVLIYKLVKGKNYGVAEYSVSEEWKVC